jgi:hypothetical protein
VPRVTRLLDSWRAAGADDTESTKRLIDLFLVSVLLDAGAGDVWQFTEPGSGAKYNRSEGLAVASLYMFSEGSFASSSSSSKETVNGRISL